MQLVTWQGPVARHTPRSAILTYNTPRLPHADVAAAGRTTNHAEREILTHINAPSRHAQLGDVAAAGRTTDHAERETARRVEALDQRITSVMGEMRMLLAEARDREVEDRGRVESGIVARLDRATTAQVCVCVCVCLCLCVCVCVCMCVCVCVRE